MADVRAGGAFIEFGAKFDKFDKAIANAGRRIKGIGDSLAGVGSQISGFGIKMTAPFAAAALVFGKVGDDIAKMSRRTGVATETLSAWSFAKTIGDIFRGP